MCTNKMLSTCRLKKSWNQFQLERMCPICYVHPNFSLSYCSSQLIFCFLWNSEDKRGYVVCSGEYAVILWLKCQETLLQLVLMEFHFHRRTGVSCKSDYLLSLHHQMEHLWLDTYESQSWPCGQWMIFCITFRPTILPALICNLLNISWL